MPSFTSPHRGVSRSEALLEASVVAPIGRAMLTTLELYQPDGAPDPIYVVNDVQDFDATKELGADRDPGATVTYLAAPVTIQRQEESDGAPAPEKSIGLANVSGVVSAALRRARGSIEPWEVVERLYASDDPSGPALSPPLRLQLSKISVTSTGASFVATYGDLVNVGVPAVTFQRAHYPCLVP